MATYPYNDWAFVPPAPTVQLDLRHPANGHSATFIGLIDSGADLTAIPEEAVVTLALEPVDSVHVSGVGQQIYVRYLVGLNIDPIAPVTLRAVAWPEDYAIIGRDILNRLRITLDGPQLQLTLEEP